MSYYKRLIGKYDVISFDIFDTLIRRSVEKPSDIFYLTAKKLYDDAGKAEKFRIERVNAELKARKGLKEKEININDIYSFIDGTQFEIEKLKVKEIETEIETCIPNQPILELFEYAIKRKKKTIIISDMYLPQKVIVEMLNRCNICDYDRLYVSCECDCNKLSGELFDYVMQENNIDGRHMIHFGDSIKADYIGAILGHTRGCIIHKKNVFKKIMDRVVE